MTETTTAGGTPHVPTYPTCDATCTTDCGHCKGNHEQARLGQIRARADAATPGPWTAAAYSDSAGDEGSCVLVGNPGTMEERAIAYAIDYPWTTPDSCEADAAFIAAAREDVPYLLGLLAEKDATIQRVREAAGHRYRLGRIDYYVERAAILAALDGQEGR